MAEHKGLSIRDVNKEPLKVSTNIVNKNAVFQGLPQKNGIHQRIVNKNIANKKLVNQAPSGKNSIPQKSNDLKDLTDKALKTEKKAAPKQNVVKIDENATYDPLDEIFPLDEELYQKVLGLELADDGFPKFDVDEPFDF